MSNKIHYKTEIIKPAVESAYVYTVVDSIDLVSKSLSGLYDKLTEMHAPIDHKYNLNDYKISWFVDADEKYVVKLSREEYVR